MKIVADIETFQNYFLLSMLSLEYGTVHNFEIYPDSDPIDKKPLLQLLRSNTIITFNGNNYDFPVLTYALRGKSNLEIKKLSDDIILSGKPSWQVANEYKITIPDGIDHIDLFAIPPGKASLKAYGARAGAQTLRDLPFDPAHVVLPEERQLIRSYCANDLKLTELLYTSLLPEISLREDISRQYGMDFRSKSDAQIAEAALKSELQKVTGKTYTKPDPTKLATSFYYKSPKIITFSGTDLNDVYYRLLREPFEVNGFGKVAMPKWLDSLIIKIGSTEYNMKIGGLHSREKGQCLRAESGYMISDWDAASFYPGLILSQKLFPKEIGAPFLKVYQSIVTRRLEAKRNKDIVTANTYKIVINSSYGKLGSLYSPLYSPELLIQTTITGQLVLLMLIERLENAGISVKSANTDGIVCYYHESKRRLLEEIIWDWELDTSFDMEETRYKLIASRDVNSYVAITESNKVKAKGVFSPPYYAMEKPVALALAKNPDRYIIPLSVINYLQNGTPLEDTIRSCRDVRHFTAIRKVSGGATWRGESLGRTVRYYNSTEVSKDEAILYTLNGNKVSTTSGCRPLMDLPDEFPSDIDYDYYIAEAHKLFQSTGALT